ncbi:SIR2 family protein [Streptomycetaceae bacterium NBC_01309]
MTSATPTTSTVLDEVVDLLGALPPEQVLVLSGAGVSIAAPSLLPSGAHLTRRVTDNCFLPGTLDRIDRMHQSLGRTTGPLCVAEHGRPAACGPPEPRVPAAPRLETLLGVAMGALDAPARPVMTLLDDVRTAPHNHLHGMLAAHLLAGGRGLTTNFDDCIEAAARAATGRDLPDGALVHLHGGFGTDPHGRGLGATLELIAAGLEPTVADVLRDRLAACRALLVVGYGGGDFFDIDAVVATMRPGSMDGCRVVWSSFEDHDEWHRIPVRLPSRRPNDELPPLISHFIRLGATVDVVCGRTADLLAALTGRWGLGTFPAGSGARPAEPSISVTPAERAAATFQLYRGFGMIAAVDDLLRTADLSLVARAERWEARSEVWWEQGRWSDLRRAWVRHTPADVDPVRRLERIGACLWVQGRLVPAYLWLTWHRGKLPEGPDRQRAARLLAETEGRVVEHMARTPELRLLASRLAPRIVDEVDRLGGVGRDTGVHAHRRLTDLVTSLGDLGGVPRSPDEAAVSREWFSQAGSLLAALSYGHRALRDGYPATARKDAELAADYRLLGDRYAMLGSPAGRSRTHLLPGAERVFTTVMFVRAMFDAQYGPWHRTRLTARFAAARAAHRVRRAVGSGPLPAAGAHLRSFVGSFAGSLVSAFDGPSGRAATTITATAKGARP